MKIERFNNELHPGITMHRIPVQAGFPGLVFTIGMLAVFLMGIPALIYFLGFAAVLGIGFAVMLRFLPNQAGSVAFVLTAVVLVFLVGIPGVMGDWREEHELDRKDLYAAIVTPPPPPPNGPSAFHCDYRQRRSKQPRDRITLRSQDQKRPQPPSPFDGTWEGRMNDLPGGNLVVADAGGGEVGGIVTFYFQMRGDNGQWRVASKYVAPLLLARTQNKALRFEVQHHRKHGSPEFGENAKFRMELIGDREGLLYNLSEPYMEPSKLMLVE